MKSTLRILFWFLVFAAVESTFAFGQQNTQIPIEALRAGGHAVLFRHTVVQVTQDRQPLDLADCASQHPLSAQGREEARDIGAAFKALKIPVGKVFASPYCRTLETAQLAFGRAEPWDALVHPAYVPVAGVAPLVMAQRVEAVRKILAAPDAGTNTILVTHGQNIVAIVGFEIAEGEMAIYRSDGYGAPHLVARILPAHWVSAAKAP